jgi:sialate O-acetylesterase
MKSNHFRPVFILGLLVLNYSSLLAAPLERPFLHPLFSDHAVLQRGVKVPVWGWTEPGTKVTVTFADQNKTATAGPDGKWMVRLKSMGPSAEPREMEVNSSGRAARVKDILVGDVWLCSGQSNMEMGIGACDVPNDIAAADHPGIRLLTVPKLVAREPVETPQCAWTRCTPGTVSQGGWGGFSAVGYYFGRELHKELGVPIGLIHSSWGGTIAEAWTSYEGLRPLPDFAERVERFRAEWASQKPTDYPQAFQQWCEKNDPGTKSGWAKADLDTTTWKTVELPRAFEQLGLPEFDGMMWFRREVELPAEVASQQLVLGLGPIDDIDTTWVNGIRVGQVNRHDQDRRYTLPANAARPGRNVITVRVLDTGGTGGLNGKAEQLFIGPAEGPAGRISLAGSWQMRDSAPLAKLAGFPQPADANNPNVTTVLYNGMIAPLLPFAIKGAIWYQGESNADRAYQYRRLLPAMIADWRKRFEVGAFPFYIVQLADWQQTNAVPRDHPWAELREAQALTAEKVKNCGLAVAIDIGDAADIHPKNKREVGRRLALSALSETYDKEIAGSGPEYEKMKKDGNAIRLTFEHTDGGLVARGGKLTGFAIAGEDRKFVWADAVIDGEAVVVSAPSVPNPVAVRYAWDINPVCNLYNGAGLPAIPFRTDHWPGVTAERK